MYKKTFPGIKMEVRQFSEFRAEDTYDYDGSGRKNQWHFEASMVSACSPLFDDCDGNYEVEEKLRAAKVILPSNKAEAETCALWVDFKSLKSANAFVERLNKYLVEKALRLEAAQAF